MKVLIEWPLCRVANIVRSKHKKDLIINCKTYFVSLPINLKDMPIGFRFNNRARLLGAIPMIICSSMDTTMELILFISNSFHNNNRNNNNIQKQQQATTAALPEATATAGQQLPVPGIRQNGQQRDYTDSYDDRKSATSSEAAVAARDYYENYDYNYYTQFEVLRNREDDRGDKSIEHKIHQQFIGSTQSRDSARGRPQNSRGRPQNTRVTSVNPVDNSNEGNESSDQVTLTSVLAVSHIVDVDNEARNHFQPSCT